MGELDRKSKTRPLSRVRCILEDGILMLCFCDIYVTWLYCLEPTSLELFQKLIVVNVRVTLVFPFWKFLKFKNRGRFRASRGLCDGMTPGLRNGSRSVTSIIVNWVSAFAEPSIAVFATMYLVDLSAL